MYLAHSPSPRGSRVSTLALALTAAACASTGSPSATEAVDRITDDLIAAAEVRTDIRTMRVCVHWIHELNPQTGARVKEDASQHGSGNSVEVELQAGFIDSLSKRLNVIEFEVAENENPEVMTSGMKSLVEAYGVTHIMVGDYVRRGKQLEVSVRLVDASTLLIVASASGSVPAAALGDDIRRHARW